VSECIPEVVQALRIAIKETGSPKLLSADIAAYGPAEMIARGKHVPSRAISCHQGGEPWKMWKVSFLKECRKNTSRETLLLQCCD
jgi:hypothetical protein